MKCSIRACPGEYVSRTTTHLAKHGDTIVVVDRVPVEVCHLCGDTLFSSDTLHRIEAVIEDRSTRSSRSAPILEFA